MHTSPRLEKTTRSQKSDEITVETLNLIMKFDKDGAGRKSLNSKVRNIYIENSRLPKKLLTNYQSYVYKEKLLSIFLTLKLNPKLYLLLRKIG